MADNYGASVQEEATRPASIVDDHQHRTVHWSVRQMEAETMGGTKMIVIRYRKRRRDRIAFATLVLFLFLQHLVGADEDWRALALERAELVQGDIVEVLVVEAEVVETLEELGGVVLRIDGPINSDADGGMYLPLDVTMEITFALDAVVYDPDLVRAGSIAKLYYGHFSQESLPRQPTWRIGDTRYFMMFRTLTGHAKDPEGLGRFNFVPLALQIE